MKVRLEDAGQCRKVMHVNVPPDAVAEEYGDIVKVFAKMAKVPGFRQGRAPQNVVERRYAKGIEDEAKERLAPKFYREALNEKGITPVAIVDVRDMVFKKEEGLNFNVTIDVAPEFGLPKYKRIPLKGNEVKVTDGDVEDAMSRLLARFAKFEDVAARTVVNRNDLVRLDYSGTCEGRTLAEMAPDAAGLGDGKDFWALVGEPEFIPGLAAGLVGMTVGEKKDIKVRFPDEFGVRAVAGREAVYAVTVNGIREKVLPRLDADFLKKLKVESESAMRDKIRRELAELAERNEKDRLKDEIAKFLLENTEFDLPQTIVAQEINLMLKNIVQRIAMQGATDKQIDEQKEEILKVAARSSAEKVKLSYILSRIADDEKIGVDEAEIDMRIRHLSQRYNVPPEKFRADLEKANGVERLKSDVRSEKTLDFLLENAKTKK